MRRTPSLLTAALLSLALTGGMAGPAFADPILPATDTEAPVLVSSSLSKTDFSFTDGPAVLTVSAHVTDASGANTPAVAVTHASRDPKSAAMRRVSGTAKDGRYEFIVSLAESSPTGEWELSLLPLTDVEGNATSEMPLGTIRIADRIPLTESSDPTIAGDAEVGATLTATPGVWAPSPVTFAYQWWRAEEKIDGETRSTYKPSAADTGQTLTVSVTGTKRGYTTETRTSAPTAAVIDWSTVPLPAVDRFAGVDRYSTAVEISKKSFEPDVPVVYVATGLSFPDALAAAPAAAAQNGPLLLTAANALPTSVLEELERLQPQSIVVVGGTGAVSASVFDQLALLTPSIRRDAGVDRFETSRVIVQNAFGASGSATAFVATAWNFPDALAASAAAGAIGAPVVLVNGKASAIDAKTTELLASLSATKAIVAGGTGVINASVEASLKAILGTENVTRLGGIDRYATAIAINRASYTQSDTVYLANGLGFADALAGAALAGNNKAPLYTVRSNCLPSLVLADIRKLKATTVVLLGGVGALTPDVAALTVCK
ncbi:MAG: cell wall-binding repeat-containing protein [Mycetocola sp.]